MSALLEVTEAGLGVTVQDRGRTGYRDIGVPLSGALDPELLEAANALAGNAADAAALEVCLGGPGLKAVSGTLRLALAGELHARLLTPQGQLRRIEPWQTVTLRPGDSLRVGGSGLGYVAVSGGFQTPPQLGSRATYRRAALGGVQGRALAVGDRLPCGALQGDPWLEYRAPAPWSADAGPIRVLLGPQDDHFTREALADFLGQPYRVTRDMDRMGMRLEGPPLRHNARGADIVSDGVTPGCIQVPANGQPIVLLADCQTSGGYPKIATVIHADLSRLAHLRAGDAIRFAAVDHVQACAALRERTARMAQWVEQLQPFRPPGIIDEAALYSLNLVSGILRGDEPLREAPATAHHQEQPEHA